MTIIALFKCIGVLVDGQKMRQCYRANTAQVIRRYRKTLLNSGLRVM